MNYGYMFLHIVFLDKELPTSFTRVFSTRLGMFVFGLNSVIALKRIDLNVVAMRMSNMGGSPTS